MDRKPTPDTRLQSLHNKERIMGDHISAYISPSFMYFFLSLHTMRHMLEAIGLGFQDPYTCIPLLERDDAAKFSIACI